MRKWLLLFMLLAAPAWGQGVRYDNVAMTPKNAQGLGYIPNATITVCTSAGTGTPCTPLATIYTSATLATTAPNPFTADQFGNFGFWAAPGTYVVTVTALGYTSFTLTATLPSTASSTALKPATSDAVQYVSANGLDTNDGLSWGTAKLTVAAACSTLPGGNSACSAVTGKAVIFISPAFTGSIPSSFAAGIDVLYPAVQEIHGGKLAANPASPVFTTGQMNETATFLLNGIVPGTELQAVQLSPGTYATEALTAGAAVPSSATVPIVFAGADYLNTSTTNTSVSAVARYSQCRVLVNNGRCWSINTAASDTAGLTTGISLKQEHDFFFKNAPSAYAGGGVEFDLFGNNAASVYALNALTINATTGQWGTGISFSRGAVATTAIDIKPLGTATSGANFNAPNILQRSSYWTGSASADDVFTFGPQIGGGANPTVTYNITHTGSSGPIFYGPQYPVNLALYGSGGFAMFFQLSNTAGPGSNTAITVPVVAADTMVLASAAQTLTNKSTSAGALVGTVASGTATMTTAAITAGNCGTTVTVAATGVATTDTITWAFNAAPAANPGELVVSQWPTAGNVNFQYCNPTAASVTPAAATLNWRVVR